jgi:hypothetical protein
MKYIATAALILALTGCGDGVSPVAKSLVSQVSDLSKPDIYGQLLPALTPEQIAEFNFPLLYIDVPSRRSEGLMRLFGDNAGVQTWIGATGTSIYLKDGLILGSRGYGDDLSIAARPTWAELKQFANSGETYTASYQHWSPQETLVTQNFSCTAKQRGKGINESCISPQKSFQNTYEMDSSGDFLAAQQWVSDGIGVVKLRRLK